MSIKYCEGCAIRGYTHSPCWMKEQKNKDGDCPCTECIIKTSCSKMCDKFFQWKADFLYTTRQYRHRGARYMKKSEDLYEERIL